jgi:hypothetical protein
VASVKADTGATLCGRVVMKQDARGGWGVNGRGRGRRQTHAHPHTKVTTMQNGQGVCLEEVPVDPPSKPRQHTRCVQMREMTKSKSRAAARE